MTTNRRSTHKNRSIFTIALAVLALLAGSTFVDASPAQAISESEETATFKYEIFTETNKYRSSNKIPTLKGSKNLDKIAQNWADYMARTADYRHNPNVFDQIRASSSGWTKGMGENIAYGYSSGQAVTEAWWNSPGHKANILSANYNKIGIGHTKNKYGLSYYVQVFGYNTTSADPDLNYSLPKDPKSPFVDVRSSDKFFPHIKWMYDKKITTGASTSEGLKFYPKSPVTREAMAAFMYREANVKNYVAPKVSPFKDVSTKDKFYKQIAWMYDAKLSTGAITSSGRYYYPKSSVTREAMAAFMYRADPSPKVKPSTKSAFVDVQANHKFYKEIQWMASKGISTGVKKGSYSWYEGKNPVTREAMAAFMYRAK